MNSQTVCLFWKEKSSNMDGFSFHLVFFTENWKVFLTSILMKTAKDLEIIRGDIHIRICKHPYHTSVVVLPRLCCMRPTKSPISLGTAHSYQRLCYEYKHSTFCRAWSGSNLSANNISRRHEDQIRRFHATLGSTWCIGA